VIKKPSDFFDKIIPEEKIYETLVDDNSLYEELSKVENLTQQINQLHQELTQKVVTTDLEKLVLSQIDKMKENFNFLRDDISRSNQRDIGRIKAIAENITDSFDTLIQIEIPKYKKQITSNELRIGEKFDTLKEVVEQNISGIKQDTDNKIENITEVIDDNLEYFNQQLQENSSEIKKTSNTYNKLSSILENKLLKENEKLEEYSNLISSLQEQFLDFKNLLEEDFSQYSKSVDSKIKNVSSKVDDRIESFSSEVDDKIGDITENIKVFRETISSEITSVKADVVINEQHLKKVEKFLNENHQELVDLKEEVFGELEKLPYGDIQENVERLNKKIRYIEDVYKNIEPEVIVKEVIAEGLLNEPPSTKNSDPLTPLDKNFVTLDQLQQHYRLFLNRIQQQLTTLGGGGETRLKYLDDVVGIATNASAYDGKFLKYNHPLGKFEFVTVEAGGPTDNITTNSISIVDNESDTQYFDEIVTLQKATTAVTNTTNPTSIHKNLLTSSYATVEYLIQATKGLSVNTVKLLSVNDTININTIEAYSASIGSTFVNFSINIDDGFVDLVATPNDISTIIYNISYTAITRQNAEFIIKTEDDQIILTEDGDMIQTEVA
jgi:hypothetical protein